MRMPGSLLARAFLLIVVLIVLSLAASVAIFRHMEQEPRTRQVVQLVVSVVNLTRAAVMSAAPEWRSALLAELAEAEGLRVQAGEFDDVIEPLPEHPPGLQIMVEQVRAVLGEETRFAARRNGTEALWVSFLIGNEEYWLAMPRERIEHPVSQVFLLWGGMVLMLALLGGYFIARQVAQPLKRLAKAARQLGQGDVPQALPESGAQEVIEVSAAFNQMYACLVAIERERALVLAGISHDLRTPLARVRIAAEMIDDESLRAGLCADVEQMDQVIRQFLDYARLDENEEAVSTDLTALVNEVVQRYPAWQIESVLPPLPAVRVRPLLLKRALANLLDNAIKYGGGEIVVCLESRQDKVALSVMDRGAGIPEAKREAVKRPFFRLDAARSDVTGAGLGLAIVERTALLHHGEFHLEARDAGGLRAILLLPCKTVKH